MNKFKLTIILFSLFVLLFSFNTQAQTTVEERNGKWTIVIDGEAFDAKGATFGYDYDAANFDQYFKELQFLGVNTIRTWGTGKNTTKLLDAAHANGIKVMLGIWMRHGRPGSEADDSFDYLKDSTGKEIMYQSALETVKAYKDHPAPVSYTHLTLPTIYSV